PQAKVVGAPAPDERLEVTVRVRPRAGLQALAEANALADQKPSQRRYMTREEYAASHGADPADLAKVEAFAKENGLSVVEKSIPRRSIVLSGNVAAFNKTFGVTLQQYEHPGGRYRGRKGPVNVPQELADIIEGVFGLDDRPQAEPHFN